MVGALVAVGILLAVAVSCLTITVLANRRESGIPLGLFRIAYGSVLFCEVAQMLYYAPLIQDPVPFIVPGEVQLTYLLIAWLAALIFMTVGLLTRTAAIVSYVAGLCTTSVFFQFEYHVDYIITGTSLLMAIAPVGQRLSLDRLRARLRPGPEGVELPADVSAVYRKLFVFVGIALVYFDSVFWKLASPMWMNGLGVWLPASVPQAVWYDASPILNQEWLVKGLGYLTLLFEAGFIVLMWLKAAAIPLAVVGLGLHLGITAVFPIPWFGLLVVALYLLVFPPSLYRWIGKRLRLVGLGQIARTFSRRVLGPTGEPPDPDRAAEVMQRSDGWEPPGRAARVGLGLLIATVVICQCGASVQSPTVRRWLARQTSPSVVSTLARLGATATRSFSRPFFGITPHTVFLDFHFTGYNHVAAIVYEDPAGVDVWLPLIRPNGQVHWMTSGRLWVFWTFRSMAPQVNLARLTSGAKRMTAFWMQRQGVSPSNATFRLLVKRVDVPAQWQHDFLTRQKERPWVDAGRVTWRNGTASAEIQNIEGL